MINVNELRIGNWVRSIRVNYMVCGIDALGNIQGVEGGTTFNLDKTTQPIPLTEEWLVKFGFEKVGKSYFKGLEIFEEDGNFYYGLRDEGQMDLHIKYVHQLQNWHFALTNKEL